MSRLLILLFMVGWAFYIVQVNSGGTGDAVRFEQNAKASGQATPGQQAAASSELQPTARATVHSPHAIAPDEAPPKPAVSSGASPPQTHPTENSEPQLTSDQGVAAEPFGHEPGEELRVTAQTSIRSGPSEAAEVIGTAHAGAKLRVKSIEAGWVQFVDPAAKKSGWIALAYLAPAERETEFQSTASAQPERPHSTASVRPKQPQKTAKLKSPKPAPKIRQLPPTYAELPADREFVPPRRGGLFGLFWKRRFTGDQFSPPPYP
jgi:Bacterial SH3 domain